MGIGKIEKFKLSETQTCMHMAYQKMQIDQFKKKKSKRNIKLANNGKIKKFKLTPNVHLI
jgi:hypothetical protein